MEVFAAKVASSFEAQVRNATVAPEFLGCRLRLSQWETQGICGHLWKVAATRRFSAVFKKRLTVKVSGNSPGD